MQRAKNIALHFEKSITSSCNQLRKELKTSMFKAITILTVAVSLLSLSACCEKKATCTTTKVSTTHMK